MTFFTVEHISLARLEGGGHAIYAITWPGAPYLGWVRVSSRRHQSGATEAWIADALNQQVLRFGVAIVEAALARPLLLE